MDVYDLVGVGFGPSNIALAISIFEDNKKWADKKKIIFFESKAQHGWHHSMMLPNTKMQISFMKDLCFLRNPRSYFTFVNYLHLHGRLAHFANLRDFNPSRREFDDYLRWVGQHFTKFVQYSSHVTSIIPVKVNGRVEYLDVYIKNIVDDTERIVRTTQLSIAIGGEPIMPFPIENKNVFHSSRFLERLPCYDKNKPHRFLVIGAGQSAAEIYRYLISNYRKSNIWVVCGGIGFKQADDSEYINEIFNHEMTDEIYNLSQTYRHEFMKKYFDTNYSVADNDIISELYREEYEASIADQERKFEILKFRRLVGIAENDDGLLATLRSTITGETEQLNIDVIICATGYSRENNHSLLKDVGCYLENPQTELPISRNYRLLTHTNFIPKIYIQGMSENTHGISDTLLSVISKRSHEVSEEIIAVCP